LLIPSATPCTVLFLLHLTRLLQAFGPRPGLPLREGQKYLGPVVLSRENGIMVPAAINTYLREYQREGVQFFWDLYNEERGGVLGDDMGLVGQLVAPVSTLRCSCDFDCRVSVGISCTRESLILATMTGKTIQVISFLSAIMKKYGDRRDVDRRRNHVSTLQDGVQWKKYRTLPPPDAVWPTCLIIAPCSVVENWKREFEKVGANLFHESTL
jgi:DNA excision repair protein ERCC-6-like 2